MSEQSIADLTGTIESAAYLLGQICGVEVVARMLRKKAGAAWERDQDERAEIYRNAAREFEKLAKEKDTLYRQEKLDKRNAAWESLAALVESEAEDRQGDNDQAQAITIQGTPGKERGNEQSRN